MTAPNNTFLVEFTTRMGAMSRMSFASMAEALAAHDKVTPFIGLNDFDYRINSKDDEAPTTATITGQDGTMTVSLRDVASVRVLDCAAWNEASAYNRTVDDERILEMNKMLSATISETVARTVAQILAGKPVE